MAPSRPFSVSRRPRRLSELIGQSAIAGQLRAQFASGRVPSGILFYGPSGTGKTTLARIVATSLQCTHADFGEPCDVCYAECWDEDGRCISPDIHEVNAAEQNGVDAAKALAASGLYLPSRGRYRIIILDEAHRLTADAQKALLKPIEDAPPHLIWILGTTDPEKLSVPLKRRCVPFQVGGLDEAATAELLSSSMGPAVIDAAPVVEAGITAPGLILQVAEKVLAGAEPAAAIGAVTGTESSPETLEICRAVTAAKWAEVAALLSKARAEDARGILAATAGYLRSCLLRRPDNRTAKAILALTAPLPFEDGLVWAATVARLYQAVVVLGERK